MKRTFVEKIRNQVEHYPFLFRLLKKAYYGIFREKAADFDVLSYNMYDLGFVSRGEQELLLLFEEGNPEVKKEAARRLVIWYASHFTGEAAEKGRSFLEYIEEHERKASRRREIVFLKAEYFCLSGDKGKAEDLLSGKTLPAGRRGYDPAANAAMTRYADDREEWNRHIGRLYDSAGLGRVFRGQDGTLATLHKGQAEISRNTTSDPKPKVSIILPVTGESEYLEDALLSLGSQTWEELEILVLLAAEADSAGQIARRIEEKDSRIRVIEYSDNGGFFDCLNKGLSEAAGEYVTCLPADSWAHSQRIGIQAEQLRRQPEIKANMVKCVRCDEKFRLHRGKDPDSYFFTDLFSLMFRREEILSELGYWDSVRRGGETEMLSRIRSRYGSASVVTLEKGPLVWKRCRGSELDTFEGFVKWNYLYDSGLRRYRENYQSFHASGGRLYIPWPLQVEKRPFPAPRYLLPENIPGTVRHFDVIDISDLRLPGGTTSSIGEELKAQKAEKMSTGLIQMPLYGFSRGKPLSQRIKDRIDEDSIQWIGAEEEVSCDILILRHPPVLQDEKLFIPKVRTKNIAVVINQAPRRDYGGPIEKTFIYDFRTCNRHLLKYFGQQGVWYPNGSVLRETLREHHPEEIGELIFADKDWANIIDIDEWERPGRPAGSRPKENRPAGTSPAGGRTAGVPEGPHADERLKKTGNAGKAGKENNREKTRPVRVGRHSRDHYVKWPEDAEVMRQVYPDSPGYEIHVLGGARSAKRVLTRLPKNWVVHEFGSMDPKEFLASLDVFVYYHHPDWVEPFGRNIFEAMTVGVPVITAPHFRSLYKDAAIYARPEEVLEKIEELMGDDGLYEKQVEKARDFIIETFGYQKHIDQIRENASYYSGRD